MRQALFNGRYDRIVSCGDDKTVKVWNAADGKLVQSLDAHDGPVSGVAVNADATRIVSCGADKTVKVFALPAKPGTKEEKPVVIALPAAASAVALSPNGLRIAVAVSDDKTGRVHVFDVASGKELLVFAEHAGAIPALSFLADNHTLVSAGADKRVCLSDMNILATLDGHAGGVTSVAFHSNGTQALSAGADKTVKLWDLTKGQVLKTFGPLPETVRAIAFNRACTQIGAASGKTVTVWNVADGKEVRKLEHPAEVAGLSFSADATRLATAAADNEVRVWELATGHELQAFLHAGPVRAVVCHGSNNALLVSGSADKTVALHTMTVTRVLSAGTPIRALTVTPNGTHVLTAGDDGKIKLWNTGNGVNDRTLEGGDKARRPGGVEEQRAVGGRQRRSDRTHFHAGRRKIAGAGQSAGRASPSDLHAEHSDTRGRLRRASFRHGTSSTMPASPSRPSSASRCKPTTTPALSLRLSLMPRAAPSTPPAPTRRSRYGSSPPTRR